MTSPLSSKSIIQDTRPWIISRSELTAGLRASTGDPRLTVIDLQEYEVPKRRPSVGRIRGLRAVCQGKSGQTTLDLVLKEPQGTTRSGMAGVGLREASFYRILSDQIPIQVPRLMAAHPGGEWLVLSLLSGGRPPEQWQPDDFFLAIDQLVLLHDRFWGLGEDLRTFTWLARPLDADLDIYVTAASTGLQHMLESSKTNELTQDIDLVYLLQRLVRHADSIAEELLKTPVTLIHGDYWPGNLYMNPDGSLVAYDWQEAGIGPGILDLFTYIQLSQWWFDPLPVSTADLIKRYRSGMAEINGYAWKEKEWMTLWNHALLWSFMADWIDLLATTPAPLLRTRHAQLDKLWLNPVRAAIPRLFPEN
jgi:hypothetical protein